MGENQSPMYNSSFSCSFNSSLALLVNTNNLLISNYQIKGALDIIYSGSQAEFSRIGEPVR